MVKNNVLAVFLGLILLLVHYSEYKNQKKIKYKKPPNIDRLISLHPPGWKEINNESSITYDTTEYDITKSRFYVDKNGNIVQLLMTWSADGLQRMGHVQQVCYNAAGNEIGKESVKKIKYGNDDLTYTYFEAKRKDGKIEDVIYWRVTGGRLEENVIYDKKQTKWHYKQQLNEILMIFLVMFDKEVPDDIMIRISSIRKSESEYSTAPYEFLENYIKMLSKRDRSIVLGEKI